MQSKTCEVCKEACHKYKCPSCSTKYCSLSCFKAHKDDICERETNRRKEKKLKENERNLRAISLAKKETEEGEITESDSSERSDDEDRISKNVLDKLGHSQKLSSMLHNEHLRKMIKGIDASGDPGKLLGQAMQIPIFTEFVDECLRIVEPQNEEEMEQE